MNGCRAYQPFAYSYLTYLQYKFKIFSRCLYFSLMPLHFIFDKYISGLLKKIMQPFKL